MIRKIWNRNFKKAEWKNLRSLQPLSRKFGLDRGKPVDRYYIEKFLGANTSVIKGSVLEIAENTYTKKFGSGVITSEILYVDNSNKKATIVGDLTDASTLPEEAIDCFICTQTLNFIYDYKSAVKGIYKLLKKNGTVLVTLAGLCQISRYDMDRWGDYWRFTSKSAAKVFEEVFGSGNVKVNSYGNVLSAVAFLEGLASDELTEKELDYNDEDYQIIITVIAKKI